MLFRIWFIHVFAAQHLKSYLERFFTAYPWNVFLHTVVIELFMLKFFYAVKGAHLFLT